jgi:hypothetical protein
MFCFKLSPRRAALLAAAAFLLGVPGDAQARIGSCAGEPVAQVFRPWADLSWYASVPDGGLEAGGAGWALNSGAAIVSPNESYYVRSPSDLRALSLGPSGSASSAPACVGPGHPTMRFFVRGVNTPGVLRVSVKLSDPLGGSRFVPIGAVAGTETWQPSPILPLFTNTLALVVPQQAVFRFEPAGAGTWYVDDVYVDPYGKG